MKTIIIILITLISGVCHSQSRLTELNLERESLKHDLKPKITMTLLANGLTGIHFLYRKQFEHLPQPTQPYVIHGAISLAFDISLFNHLVKMRRNKKQIKLIIK